MFLPHRRHTAANAPRELAMLALLVLSAPACSPARVDGVRAPAASPARSNESATHASGTSATTASDASRLAWMEGHWFSAQDGVQMEEVWTSTHGGALIGMHKDVKESRMTSFEFLRVESRPEGGLVYFASPRSAPVTPFTLIELGEKRAVFENKAHDFPQRVLYWMGASGELHARIEGAMKGSPASEEWTFTKR
jgi:hypothetical protein